MFWLSPALAGLFLLFHNRLIFATGKQPPFIPLSSAFKSFSFYKSGFRKLC